MMMLMLCANLFVTNIHNIRPNKAYTTSKTYTNLYTSYSFSIDVGANTINSSVAKYTVRDGVTEPRLAAKLIDNTYIPFTTNWICNWTWNEILDPNYNYTNNGSSHWPEIQAAGTGNLWAVYTGTNSSYLNDTVYVFRSSNAGVSWEYVIGIYSTTAGYSPYVARLSVNRENDWIYVSIILGDNSAGGGSYYPGTMWVTSWHDDGNAVSGLGTYLCDPMNWGDTYGKCAIAADGNNNNYVYLMGVDWETDIWDPNFYIDYYQSSNNGQTWTYISSLSLGTQATDVISGAPRYNNGGAVFSFCDWDDGDNLYNLHFVLIDSSSNDWYYFDLNEAGLLGIYSPAADGAYIYLPYDVQNGYDYDAYFIATTNNGASWTRFSHWDNSNTGYDTRSIGFDVTSGRAYMSYFMDDDDADHSGSVYFAYADASNLSTWYTWRTLDDVSQDYGLQATDALITVASNESWEIVDPTFLYSMDNKPHIAFRRTLGASGGGEAWHVWPMDPVYMGTGESGHNKSVNDLNVVFMKSGTNISDHTVYDINGRRVSVIDHDGIYILK